MENELKATESIAEMHRQQKKKQTREDRKANWRMR